MINLPNQCSSPSFVYIFALAFKIEKSSQEYARISIVLYFSIFEIIIYILSHEYTFFTASNKKHHFQKSNGGVANVYVQFKRRACE